LRYLIYNFFWTALDWLFPPSCGGCKTPGTRWCHDCQSITNQILPPICTICGLNHLYGGICNQCKNIPPKVTALRSWAFFNEPIRNAVHQLKYYQNIGLGNEFSKPLADVLAASGWEIDLITPVPLGPARKKERGYNQASLLAKPVALRLNYPFLPHSLFRTRETESQVDLTLKQRKLNIAGAFQANERLVSGNNILVVDDVTTSGSTLDSCADALFQAGAEKVYGLTLARAGNSPALL
jgi:competence protein ComFC